MRVLGYRWFDHIPLGLVSLVHRDDGEVWPPGPREAACAAVGAVAPPHHAPDPLCGCGFYAFADAEHAARQALRSPSLVCGVVVGWGRMVLHEAGWRAQYCEIVALLTWERQAETRRYAETASVQRFGEMYGVPVIDCTPRHEPVCGPEPPAREFPLTLTGYEMGYRPDIHPPRDQTPEYFDASIASRWASEFGVPMDALSEEASPSVCGDLTLAYLWMKRQGQTQQVLTALTPGPRLADMQAAPERAGARKLICHITAALAGLAMAAYAFAHLWVTGAVGVINVVVALTGYVAACIVLAEGLRRTLLDLGRFTAFVRRRRR